MPPPVCIFTLLNSPVLTHFPAPNGLVSKELGVTTGSYLHDSTQVKVEIQWVKGLQ